MRSMGGAPVVVKRKRGRGRVKTQQPHRAPGAGKRPAAGATTGPRVAECGPEGARSSWLIVTVLTSAVLALAVAWPTLVNPRLDADDFRYLHHLQQLRLAPERAANMEGWKSIAIVENRWDHVWFLDEEGRVRFFRPTVIASYALDEWLWSGNESRAGGNARLDRVAFGLTLTNALLHASCSALVGWVLVRWLGPGMPALAASLLFAGLWSHGEAIWYVAGRTDSLAALGFLSTVCLHSSSRSALRWAGLFAFAIGFLTKELVVVAPVVLWLHDAWVRECDEAGMTPLLPRIEPERRPLFAAYAAVAISVTLIKQWALGGRGSDFVHPYLVEPWSPQFATHLWVQLRSYAGNLLFAEWSVPFATIDTLSEYNHWAGLLVAAALGTVVLRSLHGDRRLWFLLALGFLTWLPTSFVYVSERYLYLPSLSFVGVLGLLVSAQRGRARNVAVIALLVFAGFHTVSLARKHAAITTQPGSIAEMLDQLRPLRGAIAAADPLLLANAPADWLRSQFLEETLRVGLGLPHLRAHVLTTMPGQNRTTYDDSDPFPALGAGANFSAAGSRVVRILGGSIPSGSSPQVIQEREPVEFAWARFERGAEYAARGLLARVEGSAAGSATALSFELRGEARNPTLVYWEPDPTQWQDHPWLRRRDASVRRVILP